MPRKIAIALLSGCLAVVVQAADVNQVLSVKAQQAAAGQASQASIDKLAGEENSLVADYRHTSKIVADLERYNQKLGVQVKRQNERLAELQQSIREVQVMQRQVLPQIQTMVDVLEAFISLDMPFHQQERKERITFLRDNIDRPDLSLAEKFRQVMEAYKIESEYGRKIDSYSDTVEIEGKPRDVSMLRVGRIALLYQTPDMLHTGMWDKSAKAWKPLEAGEYRDEVRKGLRMAGKQASIDMLELPVSAAVGAK